jgi:Asp/Glu/hydantoin racemase
MTSKKLAFVHTGHLLIPVFTKFARELLPEFEVFHMLDESLIRNTIAAQRLTKATTRRVLRLVESAHEGGADAVMVTCSSIGPAVAEARRLFDFPVLRVDEAMAEEAVRLGTRIGVVATLRTTLEPTIALLEETAAAAGRNVQILPALSEGAFDAVLAGDIETHDRIVSESLTSLRKQAEVIVLAQASMARVASYWERNGGPPVLSSPELALRSAREKLALAAG